MWVDEVVRPDGGREGVAFGVDGTVKDPWALVGRFPRTSSFATNTTRSVPAPPFTTTTYPQSPQKTYEAKKNN
jgi:hypothetical protein